MKPRLIVAITKLDIGSARFQVWLQLTDRFIAIGHPLSTEADADALLTVLQRLPDLKAMEVKWV